jgi:hypothetical protein
MFSRVIFIFATPNLLLHWNAAFKGSAALAFCAALLAFYLRSMSLPKKQQQETPAAATEQA